MKKLTILVAILMAMVFCQTKTSLALSPSDAASFSKKKVLPGTDSLKIIKVSDHKYYVYCSLCPIEVGRGIIFRRAIDSLDYISPLVPESAWAKIYANNYYIYENKAKSKTGLYIVDQQFVKKQLIATKAGNLMGHKIFAVPRTYEIIDTKIIFDLIFLPMFGVFVGFILSAFIPSKVKYYKKMLAASTVIIIVGLVTTNLLGMIAIIVLINLGILIWHLIARKFGIETSRAAVSIK